MSDLSTYYDESYPPSLYVTPPDPPVQATGATTGQPGAWTPAGSVPPPNVTALIAGTPNVVIASPTTEWASGSYVQTATAGAAGQAYWNGTTWVAGVSPVEEPEAITEPPEEPTE